MSDDMLTKFAQYLKLRADAEKMYFDDASAKKDIMKAHMHQRASIVLYEAYIKFVAIFPESHHEERAS